MISTVIFDFYDVIRIDPYKKWLADHGFKREGEFYDVAARYDRGLISFSGLMDGLSELSGQPSSEIDAAFKSANMFDEDVIDILRNLKSTHKIGLLSNAGGPGLRKHLTDKGIIELFDELVISGEVGYIKPEREIFEVALQRLESNASESVFIDDNKNNVDAASQLGINGLLFESHLKLKEDLRVLGIDVKN